MRKAESFISRRKVFVKLFNSNLITNAAYFSSLSLLAMILETSEFGYFRVTYSYVVIAISIAMMGLNIALAHKLPVLGRDIKNSAIILSIVLIFFTSFVSAGVLLLHIPFPANSVFLFSFVAISFFMIVFGASASNIVLSIYQANGDLDGYARFQMIWKTVTFGTAVLGGLSGSAGLAICAMAISYFLVIAINIRKLTSLPVMFSRLQLSHLKEAGRVLWRPALWPFASVAVSVVYANLEFLFIVDEDFLSGVAGDYSYASLIFMGGAALFLPFQTYAGSRVVNKNIGISGLWKLQILCFACVLLMACFASASAYVLANLWPQKFSETFFYYSLIVSIKLGVWGCYAVIGSILNFIDKGFEAFLLSLLSILLIIIGVSIVNVGFESVLWMQIFSGVVTFVVSFILVRSYFHTSSK